MISENARNEKGNYKKAFISISMTSSFLKHISVKVQDVLVSRF